ncbi:UNVERIFIED_CONTAM: hypothetical protein PYX00_007527 [Menopon gallinae]
MTSATNLLDESRARKPPASARTKTRVYVPVKTEENQVGYSIKRLLSVYESEKQTDKSEQKAPAKTLDERRFCGKVSRYSLARAQSRASEESKEVKPKVVRVDSPSKLQPPKKRLAYESGRISARPPSQPKAPPVPEPKVLEREPMEPIVPVANQVFTSFITTCFDDESKRKSKTADLQAILSEGGHFPVCSKRAINDIPSRLAEDKRDLIIMLWRRNADPYPPNFPCENFRWGLDCERIFFVRSGLQNSLDPCWGVSLFGGNPSVSMLSNDSSIGAPSGALVPHGRNIPRAPGFVDPRRERWLPEISSPSTTPLVALMDSERSLPPEPRSKTSFSKDDLFKPDARLRVVVKPSQRKLAPALSAPNASVNKKTHKLIRMRRPGSEPRPATIWHKHILFTVTSAIFLVAGGFFFFLYFLTKSPAYFNLTPPIPGLVRGC